MKLKNERTVVGLDLSSEQIRAIAGLWDKQNSKIKVIGTSEIKSSGLSSGVVTDMVNASDCLTTVMRDLRKSASTDTGLVYLGVSGRHFDGLGSEVRISISNQRTRRITRADLAHLSQLSCKVSLPLERCLVQWISQGYSIDNQGNIKDPIGMFSSYIISHNYLITGPRSIVVNLKKCLANAGLIPGDLVMAGIAAGYSLIPKSRAETGIMLINIRDLTTDVVIYSEGILRYFEVFGIGDRYFIEKLSRQFSLSLDIADHIKRKCSCVRVGLVRPGERVIIPNNGGGSKSVARQELVEILEAGIKELFFKIKEEIERKTHHYPFVEAVIITGAGCLSDGIIETAEDVFERPAKLGLARDTIAEDQILNSPEWSTPLGLISYGLERDRVAAYSKCGLAGSWFSRFRNWIEEYF